jgi:hypothetical protein
MQDRIQGGEPDKDCQGAEDGRRPGEELGEVPLGPDHAYYEVLLEDRPQDDGGHRDALRLEDVARVETSFISAPPPGRSARRCSPRVPAATPGCRGPGWRPAGPGAHGAVRGCEPGRSSRTAWALLRPPAAHVWLLPGWRTPRRERSALPAARRPRPGASAEVRAWPFPAMAATPARGRNATAPAVVRSQVLPAPDPPSVAGLVAAGTQ